MGDKGVASSFSQDDFEYLDQLGVRYLQVSCGHIVYVFCDDMRQVSGEDEILVRIAAKAIRDLVHATVRLNPIIVPQSVRAPNDDKLDRRW